MKPPVLLLVHSPLVGPATLRPTAKVLRATGWTVGVPALPRSPDAAGSFWRHQVEAAVDVNPLGARTGTIVVGHSGAGALLPAIGQRLLRLHSPVRGYIFVDAGLPAPGTSWLETAPSDLVDLLRSRVVKDQVPPWSEWFGAAALAELVPDSDEREALLAEMHPLPWALLAETRPTIEPWPDAGAGYVQLSDGYAEDAAAAEANGWPVRRLATNNHLATVTDPSAVAAGIASLARRLVARAAEG